MNHSHKGLQIAILVPILQYSRKRIAIIIVVTSTSFYPLATTGSPLPCIGTAALSMTMTASCE